MEDAKLRTIAVLEIHIYLRDHKIIKLVPGAVNSLSNLHTTSSQYGRKDFHFLSDVGSMILTPYIGKKRVWLIFSVFLFRKCQLCSRGGAIRKKVGRSLKQESDTSLGFQ